MITMRLRFAACLLAIFTTASATAPTDGPWRRSDVLALASHVADWQLEHMTATPGITSFAAEAANPRSWQRGAFWVGMTHLADVTGEKRFAEAIHAQGRANEWKPGTRPWHADDHVIAQSYLWSAKHGAGNAAITPLRATFDSVLANPPVTHLSFVVAADYDQTPCLRRWCWCDALFMSPPAWVALSRQTGDARYTTYAMREFWATTDFLYDPLELLFFRDSRFFERRDEQGRKLFWSRGNGWVFAGIANILEELPADDSNRPRLEKLFREMAAKLRAIQKPDGYWAPSLLARDNSPPESSGTGFFVYGLAWGVKHGLLNEEIYRDSIEQGWHALARAVAKDGRLGWVQQVSDRPESVAEADTQFYGVGAFLLAAAAIATLEEK
jgi:rhamnogalacturonyl hydrolase YesR